MLQRGLRSPFIPMFFFLLCIVVLFFTQLDGQIKQWWLAVSILIVIAITFLWAVLIVIYNRKYPKNRIKYWGMIPPEFRELDEGEQWVTFKACRTVYIYYSFALPIAAAVCILNSQYIFAVFFAFGALGLGQYIVYWLTIRKLNQV